MPIVTGAVQDRHYTKYPYGVYNLGMIVGLKKRSLHRTKILEGQMRGLQKMIENEEYCMDILTQSLAIQASLGSLNKLILENHVRTHLTEKMQSNDNKRTDEAVEELLKLYELSSNRAR